MLDLLRLFADNMFVAIPHAFTFIGLRRPETAYFCCDLTHLLFVCTFDENFRLRRCFNSDPSRHLVDNRM